MQTVRRLPNNHTLEGVHINYTLNPQEFKA
nr:MAG TPA: hypothetical protein [Caudoviricetes sp.]